MRVPPYKPTRCPWITNLLEVRVTPYKSTRCPWITNLLEVRVTPYKSTTCPLITNLLEVRVTPYKSTSCPWIFPSSNNTRISSINYDLTNIHTATYTVYRDFTSMKWTILHCIKAEYECRVLRTAQLTNWAAIRETQTPTFFREPHFNCDDRLMAHCRWS